MYKNILVPIAPDHRAPTGDALAAARQLASEGAKITALTVLEAIPEYTALQLPPGTMENRKAEAETELAAELGGVQDVKAVVVSGHSARTILEYAEEHDADCIVVASHRPGLADYLIGSTAARVVRHAKCSVHVIR